MGCHNISFPYRHTRPSDDKGNVDVFLETAFLSRVKAVLRDVVTVVCGV